MNLANKITMARVVMIPLFCAVYMGTFLTEPISRYTALAIFIVASLSDWLDGYIARSRNLVTNFGKFADPLADKLLVLAALICLVDKGLLPWWLVILILSREFIITGFRTIAAAENIVIAASWWGKIKTNLQLIMIIFIIAGFQGEWANITANVLILLAAFFTVMSAVDYIYKNRQVLTK